MSMGFVEGSDVVLSLSGTSPCEDEVVGTYDVGNEMRLSSLVGNELGSSLYGISLERTESLSLLGRFLEGSWSFSSSVETSPSVSLPSVRANDKNTRYCSDMRKTYLATTIAASRSDLNETFSLLPHFCTKLTYLDHEWQLKARSRRVPLPIE